MFKCNNIYKLKHIIVWCFFSIVLTLFSGYPAAIGADLQKVQVKKVKPEKHTKYISIYGKTAPARRSDIKAEATGKITEIIAKEGEDVNKDSLILKIEPREKDARMKQAEALLEQRRIEYEAAQQLTAKGFQAENRRAEALANLEAANAQLIQTEIEENNTEIRAPFSGRLEEVNVEIGTLVGPNFRTGQGSFNDGSTIASIVDYDPMKFVGYVPEKNISSIKKGQNGQVHLATDQQTEGTVSYIGSLSQEITRTFRVELEIPNPKGSLLSGVTSEAKIPVLTRTMHYIPSSALVLDKEHRIGVRTVEIDKEKNIGIVGFRPLEIVDSDINGVWVSGLSSELDIITLGQHFVSEGDSVEAVFESNNDQALESDEQDN